MVSQTIAHNEITGKFGEYEERSAAGCAPTCIGIKAAHLESVFDATFILSARRQLKYANPPNNSHV